MSNLRPRPLHRLEIGKMLMRITTLIAIERFRSIHKDRYEYDNFVYINGKAKSYVSCPKHGDFSVSYEHHFYRKNNCPKCMVEKRSKKQELTNEIIDLRLIGRSIIRLENYNGARNKIKWKCINLLDNLKTCDYEWHSAPGNVVGKAHSGCPKCYGNQPLTNFIVDEKLLFLQLPIKRLENIKNSSKKIKWKCLLLSCGHIWSTAPNIILNQMKGCPECAGNSKWKDNDIDDILKCKDIIRLSSYVNYSTAMKFECKKCNHVWDTKSLNHIIKRHGGCPNCASSFGNKRLKNFADINDIKYETEYTFKDCLNPETGRRFRFDICFFNDDYTIKALGEFDGRQHYDKGFFTYLCKGDEVKSQKLLEEQKIKDELKNEYCIKNNIHLIRIPYWDIGKIDMILEIELGLYGINYG